MDALDRRDFLALGGAALAASVLPGRAEPAPLPSRKTDPFAAPPIEMVRIGYVGIGGQGGGHVRNLLQDPRLPHHRRLRHRGRSGPTGRPRRSPPPAIRRRPVTTRGPRDFERLCETEDLDLVYNATPWEWHVPIMLAAMKNGKHTATEVPAAMTLDDCWAIVEAAEKYQKHCVMMENCNYDRMEMMVFNMVRQGLFGEILHAEGGYLHDLRDDQVLGRGRGAVAPRLGDEARRQPLSDARPRAGRQLPGHQPRRSLRLPGVDERPVARAAGLGGGARACRLAQAQGTLRARRRQRQPDQDGARPDRSSSSTAPTCRGPTAASTSCRARKGCSRAIRTASTSRGAARNTHGSQARTCSRNSSIRCGRRSPKQAQGRRPRRHGLHRGLPPDQVPARRTADRHERLRRRGAQRASSTLSAIGRTQAQRRRRRPGFHARQWKSTPPLEHRADVNGDADERCPDEAARTACARPRPGLGHAHACG